MTLTLSLFEENWIRFS